MRWANPTSKQVIWPPVTITGAGCGTGLFSFFNVPLLAYSEAAGTRSHTVQHPARDVRHCDMNPCADRFSSSVAEGVIQASEPSPPPSSLGKFLRRRHPIRVQFLCGQQAASGVTNLSISDSGIVSTRKQLPPSHSLLPSAFLGWHEQSVPASRVLMSEKCSFLIRS